MKRRTKSILAMLLSIVLLIQSVAVFSASAAEENIYDKMVSVANKEVGYMETTYPDGTFTSKYGEWYGIPNGAWCAMFCSWCANQAGISTEVLPKFASCHVGMQWFKDKNLWKEREEYTPEPGDLIFLNDCTHVGIVEKYDDGIVYTIEGNACDDNQENYGVRKRYYSALSSKITGYGLPDKAVALKFNGKATKKETAYMLPDTSSQTVWEVWENDDLEILCKDGAFYLVMYPFLSTGKFVCAYVPEGAVTATGEIPDANDFYKSRKAFIKEDVQLYHNPSDSPLMSSTGVDKKVRAEVKQYADCQFLFEKDGYYFVKTMEGVTGFTQSKNVEILTESSLLLGDVNFDGVVNESDNNIIVEYLTRQNSAVCKIVADVNLDGLVNVDDCNYLLRTQNGKLVEDHVGRPLSEVNNLLGDINNDGFINQSDCDFFVKALSRGYEIDKKRSDLNFDTKVSVNDANYLLRYINGNVTDEHIGKPAADYYTVIGDVNGDSRVTNADAELLTTVISNSSSLTEKKKKASDVNSDGAVDNADVIAINNFLAGNVLDDKIGKEICIFDETENVVPTTVQVTENEISPATSSPVVQPVDKEKTELLIADVNGDGEITISDATFVQLYIAEKINKFPAPDKNKESKFLMGDVNGDGDITISDVTFIQLYIAEKINRFPAQDKINPTEAPTTIPIETNPANVDVSSIRLPESIQVTIDESTTVSYQVMPENATDKRVNWLSVDESIATVTNEGVVTGKKVGETKIFAVASNGIRASVLVTVKEKYIPVESVSVNNPNPAPVNSGTGIQLSSSVSPNNATDKGLEWTSSNPDIASVDSNGYVTTKTAGTVTITARSTSSGKKSEAIIKVNQVTSYIPNGNYCFKLKGTNMYLDHQGGGTHGTNVLVWEGDGNSNKNQKIKLERIDDNRYKLWSAVSTNLMIDVNRGNSYSDPLKIGLNVDIWENNDWEAQEWLFTKTYDGYYIIRLNMLQEGAMEASGTNNGDNIFYGTFNCENDRQKWELVNTSEYHIPETKAWVCNTGDIGNVHVRSGPGSSYASIGGFNEGQEVTIIGDTGAEWLKVRGANRHNGETIEGYSHRDYYTTASAPTVRERDAWIYNTSPIGNVNVRQGPDTGYNSIGGFNEGQKITVIGELSGSWYNVRGTDRHSGNTIEGYTHSDYITFEYHEPTNRQLDSNTFMSIVSAIGKQTDWRYDESGIMCSVYCISYVRAYLFNDYRQPTYYWNSNNGGAQWSSCGGNVYWGDVLGIARNAIDSGKPAIIHVNWSGYTHYVVAIGYNNNGTSLSDFTCIDPYYGNVVSLSKYSLFGDNQIIIY